MLVYCYIAIVYGKTQGYMYRRYIVLFHIFIVLVLQCNCSWSSLYIVSMLCSCTNITVLVLVIDIVVQW